MEIPLLAARHAEGPIQLPVHGTLRRSWYIPFSNGANSIKIVRRAVDRRQICRILRITFCSKLALKSLYVCCMTGGYQIEQRSSTKVDTRSNRLVKGNIGFSHNEIDAQHRYWSYQGDLKVIC